MDLRVENPKTTEGFAAEAQSLKHPLPWDFSKEDAGTIVDANGDPVLVVDYDRERHDHDVLRIVGLVLVAVNTCGGFKCQP